MFWFGLMAQILVFAGISFGLPTLALHLKKYDGFDEFWVGIFFAMPAIAYILNSLMVF